MPIFNIWTHLFVCFSRLRIIFPYKGRYTLLFTRSSTYNLYSNKTSPYWKWKGEKGGHLLYPGLRTRLHRMVTANGPSPDTYTLIFISAGFLWIPLPLSLFLLLFLPLRLTLFAIQIVMHDIKHGCDYLAISRYESLNPVNAHHCSHAYSRSFPSWWNITENLWRRPKIGVY